jgi:murein DD-endopeptidase MepM/ murein hydrolase activator NlpD
MSQIKYAYNPKTCRYEPAQLSFWGLSGYVVLFGISTVVLFVGLLFLHSKLFTSDKAKALRKENAVLRQHHASLQQELTAIEEVLVSIREKETSLHKKLFDATSPDENSTEVDRQDQERILLADASGFRGVMEMLKEKSTRIRSTSDLHNEKFKTISVSDKDLNFLMGIPSITPVVLNDQSKLASGFGVRINPFHKGNYDHPGADFAAERGSPVMATAGGRVIRVVGNSSLQAGYGNYIEVDHGNAIITRYAHLEEVRVKPGQKITKGTVIGTVGMSGGTIAPHVHYEIIRKGDAVNPVPYMMEGLSGKDYSELQKLGSKKNQSLD